MQLRNLLMRRDFFLKCLLAGVIVLGVRAEGAAGRKGMVLLPENFSLHGSRAAQVLIAQEVLDGVVGGQLTEGLDYVSSDPEVVRVKGGVAFPIKDGTAVLTVRKGDLAASASVTVAGVGEAADWSFRNNVQPVLAKFGCSAGACHGAAAGQNGFRLSLRGYDAEGDYLSLTRHAFGRRIIPEDPGRSLLLLKATGAAPHKGGKKFDADSLEYKVLSEWIAGGSRGPEPEDARIDRIEIFPKHVSLRPGMTQQLSVRAFFSDGHSEEVTRWAKYTDANSTVTQVEEDGKVRVLGHGEGAITAWYLSRIAIAMVTAPYENKVEPEVFAKAPRRNFIDDLVFEKLKELNLPPSPGATDSEFQRRAYLDAIGVLPSAEEAREFLDDASPGKRDRLIEALLARPEFVDYWAYKWSDLLLVNSERLRPPAMWTYYNWIRNQVALNTPWDEMARRIVTAKGSTLENGAANFYTLHEDPANMAETASQAFLGMSINCAKCHNHPMEKWTNDEYYAMANLFARVRAKSGPGDGDRIVFTSAAGDLNQPLRGRPQPPRPLDGEPFPIESPDDRREHLAAWLTSPDNPYFTRSIVNRVWANFFGAGLVESVDDLRVTNPASNEKLLSAAADYLAGKKYDLKALMRAILQSNAYQRSSATLPENAQDSRFYSRYYTRRLPAEVLLDAFSKATGVPTKFPNYPEEWRALQLPDANVASYFLKSFGRAERIKTCECERTEEPSMAQVLHIANGETLNKKLSAGENRIGTLLRKPLSRDQIVEETFLAVLSRYPTSAEKEKVLNLLPAREADDFRAAVEDFWWALMSGKEFLFNH